MTRPTHDATPRGAATHDLRTHHALHHDSGANDSRVEVPIDSDADIVRVRQAVRSLTVRAGMSIVEQTKMITACSELARNALTYGGGGTALLEVVANHAHRGVRATFSDRGPGIPDVELALTDGWTSGGGLGLGLSGARRLVDEFSLETTVGAGTTVHVVKWSR